ncbi:hypothetical protein CLV65_1318 [Pseudoscardovia suis]|uniref:Uncharacterized protein n=2 Tax=Pseudoscardovia suis TaxID=987063 RepID=A0A261F4K1_9BIFI|nr:hypothetical protein PSSU_0108 [Pseudoscardovia suis]PJJ65756.1 hypothetical protein CLV65_1318 [Pseudoscardovia suis]
MNPKSHPSHSSSLSPSHHFAQTCDAEHPHGAAQSCSIAHSRCAARPRHALRRAAAAIISLALAGALTGTMAGGAVAPAFADPSVSSSASSSVSSSTGSAQSSDSSGSGAASGSASDLLNSVSSDSSGSSGSLGSSDSSDSSDSASVSASATYTAPADAAEVAATYTTAQLGDSACVGAEPDTMRLTPDGSQLFVVSSASTVCAVSTADLSVESVISLPGDSMGVASGIAMSQDGSRLFVATSGGVAVISTADRSVTTLDLTTTNFAVARDGKTLYALAQGGAANTGAGASDASTSDASTSGTNTGWSLQVWNVDDGTHQDVAVTVTGSKDSSGSDSSSGTSSNSADLSSTPSTITGLAASGDGGTVLLDAQYSQSDALLAVNTSTGAATSLATFSVGYLAALSSDGTELYLPSTSLHSVLQANVDTQDVQVFSVDSAARILGFALSGDGSRLVVRTSAGSHLFDTATGSELRGLALNEPDGYLSRDGGEMYSVSAATGSAAGSGSGSDSGSASATGGSAQIEVRLAKADGGSVAVGSVAYDGAGASDGSVDVKSVVVGTAGAADGKVYVLAADGSASSGSSSGSSGSSDGGSSSGSDSADAAAAGRLIVVDLTGGREALQKADSTGSSRSWGGVVAVAVIAVVLIALVIWLCLNPQILRGLAAARSHPTTNTKPNSVNRNGAKRSSSNSNRAKPSDAKPRGIQPRVAQSSGAHPNAKRRTSSDQPAGTQDRSDLQK